MIHLTQAEYDELNRKAQLADFLLKQLSDDKAGGGVVARAQGLVRAADAAGLVLTIEQKSLQPLAMGHYETVVSVRPKRGSA